MRKLKYVKFFENFDEKEISQILTFKLEQEAKDFFEYDLWIKKWENEPGTEEEPEKRIKQIGKMQYLQENFKVIYQYFDKFENGLSYAPDRENGISAPLTIYNTWENLERSSKLYPHALKIASLTFKDNPNCDENFKLLEIQGGLTELNELHSLTGNGRWQCRPNNATFIVGYGTIELVDTAELGYDRCSYYALVTITENDDNSIELHPSKLMIQEDANDTKNNKVVQFVRGPWCKIEDTEIFDGLKPGHKDHRGFFSITSVEIVSVK